MMSVNKESIDPKGIKVAVAVFIGMVMDGMCFQALSLVLPVLIEEFSISKVQAGALGTYLLFGMGLGGVLVGWLADRFGRIRVVLWSATAFAGMNTILCFSQGYYQFAILSFMTGFGISGIYNIGTLMVAEYIPTSRRTTVLGIIQAGWSVGYILAAFASVYLLPVWGWRSIFVACLVPAFVLLLLLRGITDPPGYTASVLAGERKKGIWTELLGNKKIKITFFLWMGALFMLQFGYYGATVWMPSYIVKDLGINLKEMGWYVAGTYTAMVFGKILAGRLADMFGRRVMWVFASLSTAIALPLIMKFATPVSVAYLLLIFGFLYGAPFAIQSTYISESFPATVRGTAVSTANAFGKIGSMFAPIFIGLIAQRFSIGYGIAILGIAYALGGLIPGLFIREKMYDPKYAVRMDEAVTKQYK